MTDWKEYLATIYFDVKHPASYAGPDKLYKIVKKEGKHKIGKYRIRKWLQDQESYSLTKPARRQFPRSRVIVNGIDYLWDMDLMDMTSLSKQNEGYKYVLVAIDIFSRFAYGQPIQSKQGTDVVKAMEVILSGPRRPRGVRTDRGMEFRSREFNKYLNQHDIHHRYALNTETKANYAERFIKTLKHRLFRYLLKHNTKRYIDVLQDTVYSYNHTHHRSLGTTPVAITKDNEGESRLPQYLLRKKKDPRPKRYKYTLGQTVRISHVKSIFDREYSQKWTGELFKIDKRYKREGLPVYKLKVWSGDSIEGTFYESELQSVHVDEATEYRVEKVLKRRTLNKQKEVLVRWLHWPPNYDSWIPERDLKHYS